jgi:hypothetical protein
MEIHTKDQTVTWRLEGRFVGSFAEHAQNLVLSCTASQQIVFDLSEVIFVDATGEAVLQRLKRLGVQFVARSCYGLNVCERLRLRRYLDPIDQSPKATADKDELTHGH